MIYKEKRTKKMKKKKIKQKINIIYNKKKKFKYLKWIQIYHKYKIFKYKVIFIKIRLIKIKIY